MTSRLLLVWSLTCVAVGAAELKRPSNTGSVHIVAVDGLGAKLEGGKVISFKNQRTLQEFAGRFRLDRFLVFTATSIPYGRYDLRIAQPGFPDSQRSVEISQGDVEIQVCVRTSTVHIIDVGPLNTNPQQIDVQSFRSREDDFDLANTFQYGSAVRIPYGIYDLRAKTRFSREFRRRVDVFQPDVWVIAEFEVSPTSLPEYRAPQWIVRGTIDNIPLGQEPLYVSLVGAHINFVIDDKVNVAGTSGTFTLAGFNPMGQFLLVISGPKGILDIRPVHIPLQQPLAVDLANQDAQR